MGIYNHTFKFREPYQVLIDDLIVLDSQKLSFDLLKGLKRTLQAEIKPMITQCCMQALYKIENQAAIAQANNYERRRCNHNPREPKSPLECIESIVNIKGLNKHRYIVAAQDINIRRKLRHIPGVPLIYINRSVMVMEPISDISEKVNDTTEKEKLYSGLNNPNANLLGKMNTTHLPVKTPTSMKRKSQNPNPLSVKKKQIFKVQSENQSSSLPKRKRKRKHKTTKNSDNDLVKAEILP